jgi:ferredoxin
MPQVTAQGKNFTCEAGANLRQVLMDNGVDLYNGNARIINCMGIGTCGTCAVQIEGEVSAANWKDIATPYAIAKSPAGLPNSSFGRYYRD